jgi:endonuclease-8
VPEGDTIHRAANNLRAVLEGRPLIRIEARRTPGRRPPPGTIIEAVEAVGKHLLIRFADRTTLRTHMRMSGSWHLYKTGDRWRKPAHLARAIVEVEGWTAVCFAAPVVELETEPVSATRTAHLGPDLTTDDADIDAAAARMVGDAEVGVALLDQRVACGVGNIFKSESLFAAGINPFTPVDALDHQRKIELLRRTSKLLRASVATSRATPAVYARAGQPCLRCGTPIRAQRQGEQARTTYWCPTCQK